MAIVYVELGRVDEARAFAREALAAAPPTDPLTDIAWVAAELELGEELSARLEQAPLPSRWIDAARALLAGDNVGAAEVFADIGSSLSEAHTRLRAAEQLVSEGRRAEADEQLERALAFFRSVGATRYIRKGEALLAMTA